MYGYEAKVIRVIDGDTLKLEVGLGFDIKYKMSARLHGIDTHEMYGVKKESEEYKKGFEAKTCVNEWLSKHGHLKDGDDTDPYYVMIKSHDGKKIDPGKYSGRWIVEVWPVPEKHTMPVPSLTEYLIQEGHAKEK